MSSSSRSRRAFARRVSLGASRLQLTGCSERANAPADFLPAPALNPRARTNSWQANSRAVRALKFATKPYYRTYGTGVAVHSEHGADKILRGGRVEICTGNRNEATFDIAESRRTFSALYALRLDYRDNQRGSAKKIAAISECSVSASVAHFSPCRTLAKAPDQWGDELHQHAR